MKIAIFCYTVLLTMLCEPLVNDLVFFLCTSITTLKENFHLRRNCCKKMPSKNSSLRKLRDITPKKNGIYKNILAVLAECVESYGYRIDHQSWL